MMKLVVLLTMLAFGCHSEFIVRPSDTSTKYVYTPKSAAEQLPRNTRSVMKVQPRPFGAGPTSLPWSFLVGTATGDLGGTLPNPTVQQAQGGTLQFGSS